MNEFITLDKEDLPANYTYLAKYMVEELAKEKKYYDEEKMDIALIEDNLPLVGTVWRIIIYDRLKAKNKMIEYNENGQLMNMKKSIMASQIVSIYYDKDKVLSYTDEPYFEIYDGDDVLRYTSEEIYELYDKTLEILDRVSY